MHDIIFNLPLPGKKKSELKEMVLARYPLYVPLEDSSLPAEVAAIWQEKNTNPALTKFVECIQEEMPMSLKSIS